MNFDKKRSKCKEFDYYIIPGEGSRKFHITLGEGTKKSTILLNEYQQKRVVNVNNLSIR
jgi:hypothetical protein